MSHRFLLILSLGVLSIVWVAFAAIQYFSYSAGSGLPASWPMAPFYGDSTSGNAGTVYLGQTSPDWYASTAQLNGTNLVWTIWTQAAGIATFDAGAHIIPPTTGAATTTFWWVNGTMTIPNAGTIQLSWANTALCFNPVSQRLQGYGWNEWLGRVYLGDWAPCNTTNWWAATSILAQTGAGFLGRVKVIGNVGGTTIYDTLYSQGVKFNASVFNTTLQRIRKNVGLLSRNIAPKYNNASFTSSPTALGNKIFYITGSTSEHTIDYTGNLESQFESSSIQSLIIIWGDLYIHSDITGGSTTLPKGIIVLKNDAGKGGSIYINQNVKQLKTSIFAEGTIYSGDNSVSLYNNTMTGITTLPDTQLWVLGSFISRNTIGGAAQGAAVCPFNTTSCTFETALQYDLNYFRDYRKVVTNRAYKDATLDNYSVILEYDARVLSSPPPGFE